MVASTLYYLFASQFDGFKKLTSTHGVDQIVDSLRFGWTTLVAQSDTDPEGTAAMLATLMIQITGGAYIITLIGMFSGLLFQTTPGSNDSEPERRQETAPARIVEQVKNHLPCRRRKFAAWQAWPYWSILSPESPATSKGMSSRLDPVWVSCRFGGSRPAPTASGREHHDLAIRSALLRAGTESRTCTALSANLSPGCARPALGTPHTTAGRCAPATLNRRTPAGRPEQRLTLCPARTPKSPSTPGRRAYLAVRKFAVSSPTSPRPSGPTSWPARFVWPSTHPTCPPVLDPRTAHPSRLSLDPWAARRLRAWPSTHLRTADRPVVDGP
jgi:hypothetical protein